MKDNAVGQNEGTTRDNNPKKHDKRNIQMSQRTRSNEGKWSYEYEGWSVPNVQKGVWTKERVIERIKKSPNHVIAFHHSTTMFLRKTVVFPYHPTGFPDQASISRLSRTVLFTLSSTRGSNAEETREKMLVSKMVPQNKSVLRLLGSGLCWGVVSAPWVPEGLVRLVSTLVHSWQPSIGECSWMGKAAIDVPEGRNIVRYDVLTHTCYQQEQTLPHALCSTEICCVL